VIIAYILIYFFFAPDMIAGSDYINAQLEKFVGYLRSYAEPASRVLAIYYGKRNVMRIYNFFVIPDDRISARPSTNIAYKPHIYSLRHYSYPRFTTANQYQ